MTDDYTTGLKKAAEILSGAQNVLLLSHVSPDGDTIGSAYALCLALQKLGKNARVECADKLPEKYAYLYVDVESPAFEPDCIVTADVAALPLLGDAQGRYGKNVALCIDHHPSNTLYAAYTLLDATAAATCQVMADVIKLLGVKADKNIANCIYTGLATDTGCFRYSSTSPKTLRLAADMVEAGAQNAVINKAMFETVSRERLSVEKMGLASLDYYFDNRVALIYITADMRRQTGATESDLEGLASMPARIEGVLVGITVKEKTPGVFKISVRANKGANASEICARLGGGGHVAAAGCQVKGSLEDAKSAILAAAGASLGL